MIIQALCEYYNRKANSDESSIAPPGFEYKEIPFIIVISEDGNFVRIEDTRELNGKKKRAKTFLVPASVERTSGVKANLLWDTVEYVLGVSTKQSNKVGKKRDSFLERLKTSFCTPEHVVEGANALIKFLESDPTVQIETAISGNENEKNLWYEIIESNANIIFKIDGHLRNLCEELKEYCVPKPLFEGDNICLVSGKKCAPESTHSSIKNVQGAQPSGAALISFNKPSFTSFGKKQNQNAPISPEVAFQYTTALNHLLGKNSENKTRIADTTTIFWAEKKVAFESQFSNFFGYKTKDDPDNDVKAVKELFAGVYTGRDPEEANTRFYILGLAPNAARLAVRFWLQGKVSDFAENLIQHFNDIEIVRPVNDNGHYALFWILSALAQENKVDNIPHHLAGSIVTAVLTGGVYPKTMLQQTLRRIKATGDVSRIRAGVLKAFLNRFNRTYNITNEKEITMALDKENTNVGYRLGRLFATLEKIQQEASPGLNATIKDRFYGAASGTPVTVFPRLLDLSNHHLAKMDNIGIKTYREQLLGEIISAIPSNGLPAHLSMEDQARFAIGYYHQRQDFFTKKDNGEDK